ncbi:hypothetical protein TNCV_2090151 [Trichonephila clavipes]|nr:hypothetical protein TNCV_2090151 [Trichonephila clavipes]
MPLGYKTFSGVSNPTFARMGMLTRGHRKILKEKAMHPKKETRVLSNSTDKFRGVLVSSTETTNQHSTWGRLVGENRDISGRREDDDSDQGRAETNAEIWSAMVGLREETCTYATRLGSEYRPCASGFILRRCTRLLACAPKREREFLWMRTDRLDGFEHA